MKKRGERDEKIKQLILENGEKRLYNHRREFSKKSFQNLWPLFRQPKGGGMLIKTNCRDVETRFDTCSQLLPTNRNKRTITDKNDKQKPAKPVDKNRLKKFSPRSTAIFISILLIKNSFIKDKIKKRGTKPVENPN